MLKTISVIIPTYNEAKNIAVLVHKINRESKKIKIAIVDDNSTDQTQTIVKKLQKKSSNLFLIKRKKKGGRGSAVLAGFAYACQKLNTDFYIEMDADLSHPAEQIKLLLKKAAKNRVVIASRYCKGGKIINVPLHRKILSFLANQYINFALNTKLADSTNGFRCYSKSAIKIMLKHHYQSSGYIVLSETIILLKKHGFKFVEVPTIFTNRVMGKSNANFQEFWQSLKKINEIRLILC